MQSELNDMVDMVSPFESCVDPLMRKFADDWRDTWHVGLSPSQGHFVGVFKSDWNGVSTDVCVDHGHEVRPPGRARATPHGPSTENRSPARR